MALSEIGRIGQALSTQETEPPRLQAQVSRLVRRFAIFGGAVSILAVLLYGTLRGGWLDAVLAGIALGMSMLPEEFPVVLAVFMAMGAWRISRARAYCAWLRASSRSPRHVASWSAMARSRSPIFAGSCNWEPDAMRDSFNSWLATMNADMDWDVVTMELQLHARRNPEFAKRFYALEERLTNFYADIISERFARVGRKPPIDARSLSLAFRTLACSLNLKIPQSTSARANEAGRIIGELVDVILDPNAVVSGLPPVL